MARRSRRLYLLDTPAAILRSPLGEHSRHFYLIARRMAEPVPAKSPPSTVLFATDLSATVRSRARSFGRPRASLGLAPRRCPRYRGDGQILHGAVSNKTFPRGKTRPIYGQHSGRAAAQ